MSKWQSTIIGDQVTEVSPASVTVLATIDDATDLPKGIKAVRCTSDGNLVYDDWAATVNSITLPMVAGQQINIRPRKIKTGTTGAYLLLLG